METELGGIKQWLNDAEERLGPGVTECRNRLGKETLPPGTPFVLRRDAKMLEHKVGHIKFYCLFLSTFENAACLVGGPIQISLKNTENYGKG